MSNMVECKSCKHPVDSTAKTCPSCGVARPGVNTSASGCLIVFILVMAIGGVAEFTKDKNTPTPPKTETTDPAREKTSMGFTTAEFISAYRNAAQEMNLIVDSNNLTVNDSESGDEQITKSMLSNNLALVITADKYSNDVTDVIFIGTGDGTLKSGANVIMGIFAAVIATNPGLSTAERKDIVRSLGFIDSKNNQLGGTTIHSGIKYTLNQTESTGTWLVINSAKDDSTP